MENNLFIGMIAKVIYISPDHEGEFEPVKTAVLYKDNENIYTDLDENLSYYVFDEKKAEIGELIIDTSTLFKANINDFKPDYQYLIAKHKNNGIKIYNNKRKRRIFKK